MKRFVESKPYLIDSKPDMETRELVYFVKKASAIPPDIAVIAGDAIQNLRTALDYLAQALVEANRKHPPADSSPLLVDTGIGFPIMDELPFTKKQKAFYARKIEGMGKKSREILGEITPYKGGDNTLWRLHRLNIIDKHRALVTVGISLETYAALEWESVQSAKPNIGTSLQDGSEILRIPLSAQPRDYAQFTFSVAINEGGVTRGVSLIYLLRTLYMKVITTVEKFAEI